MPAAGKSILPSPSFPCPVQPLDTLILAGAPDFVTLSVGACIGPWMVHV